MTTLIDLGHPIHDGMAAYPGLPNARVVTLLDHDASRPRYGNKAEFALTGFELAGNTGTYLDSPWHRHRDEVDVAGIPLEAVAALPGLVVDAAVETRAANGAVPDDVEGGAVLIRTGWSEQWGSDGYYDGGPYCSEALVDRLLDARPRLVGVDFANVDDPADEARPAHTRLLGAGIVIVEHMRNLDRLPARGFRLHCAPLAVHGAASMPVRPYAEIIET